MIKMFSIYVNNNKVEFNTGLRKGSGCYNKPLNVRLSVILLIAQCHNMN